MARNESAKIATNEAKKEQQQQKKNNRRSEGKILFNG